LIALTLRPIDPVPRQLDLLSELSLGIRYSPNLTAYAPRSAARQQYQAMTLR
jgi:hypothetical protein